MDAFDDCRGQAIVDNVSALDDAKPPAPRLGAGTAASHTHALRDGSEVG